MEASQGGYEGDERRGGDDRLRQRFQEAIAAAAEQAAQKVAAIHRRRLVFQTFLAALATSAIIGVGLTLAINSSQRSAAQTDVLYTCRLLTRISSDLSGFVGSDATLRLKQARSAVTARLLSDLERVIPVHDLQAASRQSNSRSVATALAWKKISADLATLGATDCVKHLPAS